MDLEEIRKQKNKYERKRDENYDAMNSSETEAVRQLILITTIFLAASLFVLQREHANDILSSFFKNCLILSWISLALSMFTGVGIFIQDRFFFEKWARADDKTAKEISKTSALTQEQIDSIAEQHHRNLSEHTSDALFATEIGFLFIGVFLLFIVATQFIR